MVTLVHRLSLSPTASKQSVGHWSAPLFPLVLKQVYCADIQLSSEGEGEQPHRCHIVLPVPVSL